MKKKLKFVIVALGLGVAGGFAASSLGTNDRPVSPCKRVCIPEC
jgi:hypothetical protein